MVFYFTFGQAHVHSHGSLTLDKDCVLEVEAPSYSVASKRMLVLFGTKWSMCYEELPDMKFFPRGVVKI